MYANVNVADGVEVMPVAIKSEPSTPVNSTICAGAAAALITFVTPPTTRSQSLFASSVSLDAVMPTEYVAAGSSCAPLRSMDIVPPEFYT